MDILEKLKVCDCFIYYKSLLLTKNIKDECKFLNLCNLYFKKIQNNKKIDKANADEDANKISEKFPDTHSIGDTIADNLIKLGLKGAMTQFGGGKSKANLSDFWIDNGGKDGTPKTDMYSDNYNISLKKKGGSQLASGMTGETIATFNAALLILIDV